MTCLCKFLVCITCLQVLVSFFVTYSTVENGSGIKFSGGVHESGLSTVKLSGFFKHLAFVQHVSVSVKKSAFLLAGFTNIIVKFITDIESFFIGRNSHFKSIFTCLLYEGCVLCLHSDNKEIRIDLPFVVKCFRAFFGFRMLSSLIDVAFCSDQRFLCSVIIACHH